jgi:hypothetical protein
MQNGESFFPAINMCEVSHCKSKTHKFVNFSVLPGQVQNRAEQDYRVPVRKWQQQWRRWQRCPNAASLQILCTPPPAKTAFSKRESMTTWLMRHFFKFVDQSKQMIILSPPHPTSTSRSTEHHDSKNNAE